MTNALLIRDSSSELPHNCASRHSRAKLLSFEHLDFEHPDSVTGHDVDDAQGLLPFADLPFAVSRYETLPPARLPLGAPASNNSGGHGFLKTSFQDCDDPYSGNLFDRVIESRPIVRRAPAPSALTATVAALGIAILIVGLSSLTATDPATPNSNPRVANNLPPARIVGAPFIVSPQGN